MNRFALNHIRLISACIVGLAAGLIAPAGDSTVLRLLIGWNSGAALFLLLIYLWMRSLSASQICSRFIEEDESASVILTVVIAAALLSLLAIVALLSTMRDLPAAARGLHFALAAITVVDSWLLVGVMFTLHYADLFYSASPTDRPMDFPHTPMPVFWDFAYFSFTISAACQTSDVGTRGTSVRRIVLFHTIIAFLFNASILGFAINVTAGLFAG